jgi:hypothetical protein
VIEPKSYEQMKQEIAERMKEDRHILEQLRKEVQPLKNECRRIQPRNATAVSLVGTDGGNNNLQFDPFIVHLVRVVDSSNNEYSIEAITPTTDINKLSAKQFDKQGNPRTPLGQMMDFLGVKSLTQLSPVIRLPKGDSAISPTWVQVYRELVEWATLFSIIKKEFGTDTLIIFDGLLRSKIFSKNLFAKLLQGINEGIEQNFQKNRRRIYIAGLAKHSKVLSRYRLAMMLEEVLTTNYPAYVLVPRELEEKSYVWPEYARGDDRVVEDAEANKFVGGKMFFVKFGAGTRDPIWPIDIFSPQETEAQIIMGYMLADAINGFPVPFYPLCLQKAHENAALVDFDFDILQDQIYDSIRDVLGDEASVLDAFRLQDSDPARARY